MAFDGILMHHLCAELKPLILGGRVDKIHQPEKDELTIGIRGFQHNYTLFISIDASMPYFTTIHDKRENPQDPPMFCMLLRKHLVGGKIHDMYTLGYERILVIEIESKNDFGDLEIKKLYAEIMGKHSNIILTKPNGVIIDSIKRVSMDMSRVRTILPGLRYEILSTDKIDFSLPSEEISAHLSAHFKSVKLVQALVEGIQGFSPILAKWMCMKLELEPNVTVEQLSSEALLNLEKLFDFIKAPFTSSQRGFIFSDGHGISKRVYFLNDLDPTQSVQGFDSLSEAVDKFFYRSNRENKMHQRTTSLKKTLSMRIERYRAKLSKQNLELIDAEHADESKQLGELIIAHHYLIEKGMNRVEVQNYYVNPPQALTIELDTRLDAIENAQRHFKKYNKLKNALIELKKHISETQEEVAYLENVLTLLNNADDSKLVEDIREELVMGGYVKGKSKSNSKSRKSTKMIFKQYKSSDGMDILVGKSSLQNDQLTTKIASNKDVWLHTKDIPGSHVIIRTEGITPSEETLYEAAMITALHSKAKESSNVPVDYTLVKNVSKPSGSKPGMVIYVGNKTLFVTPDYDFVKKLEKN